MTKTYVKFELNTQLVPPDPESALTLQLQMLDMVKADLESGALLDWGVCADLSGGYAITELSGAELNANLAKWSPMVLFDARQVLSVDQVVENVKKAAAAAR